MRGPWFTVCLAGFLLLHVGCAKLGPRQIAPVAISCDATSFPPAVEQSAADDLSGEWTKERVVRRALARDPALAVARAEIAVAFARQRDTARPEDPQLRGGATRNRRGGDRSQLADTDTFAEYDMALRMFPANPWERRAEMERAAAEIEAAQSMLRLIEQQAVQAVVEEIMQLQEAEADLAYLDRLLDLRTQRKRIFQEQAAHGRTTAAEAAQASAGVLDVKQARDARERERDRLHRRLAARAGLVELPVPLRPTDAFTDGHVDELMEKMATMSYGRAEIDVLNWRMRAAEAGVAAQRALRRPWASHVQVGFGLDDRPGTNNEWSIQAGITLPLFSRNDQMDGLALTERNALEARLLETRETVTDEVIEAGAILRDAVEGFKSVRESIAPVKAEVHAILHPAEGRAELDPIMVLRLEEVLLDMEQSLVKARFEVEQAQHALESALGARW